MYINTISMNAITVNYESNIVVNFYHPLWAAIPNNLTLQRSLVSFGVISAPHDLTYIHRDRALGLHPNGPRLVPNHHFTRFIAY